MIWSAVYDLYVCIFFFFLGLGLGQESDGTPAEAMKDVWDTVVFSAIWPVTLALYVCHKVRKGGRIGQREAEGSQNRDEGVAVMRRRAERFLASLPEGFTDILIKVVDPATGETRVFQESFGPAPEDSEE